LEGAARKKEIGAVDELRPMFILIFKYFRLFVPEKR
jgi:hypothetical protein